MSKFHWSTPIMAVSATALLAGVALASPPPADTVIGNQAAATYVSDGQTITVQSNLVETIVNEVFGLELNTSQTRNAAPGGFAFFPHTLNNNANTDDIFDFTIDAAVVADDFPLTAITIFADANQDGVPDNLTPITFTPSILAGESFGIVVRATVPATANPAQSSDFNLTATSRSSLADADPTNDVSQTNTDSVAITTDGIIDLQKNQVLANDADGNGVFSLGDTVRVNLTYSNTGIADATNVVLLDILPSVNLDGAAILLDYTLSSGVWSDAPGITLTEASDGIDASNAQGASLSYEFDGSLTVLANIDTVPAGRSGTLSFDYIIVASPQGTFQNIASVTTSTQTETFSNGSPVDVASVARIIVADAEGTDLTGPGIVVGGDEDGNLDTANASTTDTGTQGDDIITDDRTIFAGSTLTFDFVLTNLGNETDTFNLDVANLDFPNGTVFDFVAADGVTPLIGDSVTLGTGETVHAQLLVTLPFSTPETLAASFDAVITASSQADQNASGVTAVSFIGDVAVPSLDLTNTDAAGTPETGIGNGNVDDNGNPFETVLTDPGEQLIFNLQIALEPGQPPNSFDLGTGILPDGWVVEFFLPDGTPLLNTGALVPTDINGALIDYIAVVTIPEGAPPATENILFTATSPSNGASDAILNAVTVNEIFDIAIEANTDVQAAPGGVAVIAHTLINQGNSLVTAADLTIGAQDPFTDQGLVATLFYDADDDGLLGATDPIISNISGIIGTDGLAGLSPDETARIFIRVQVPATSGLGLVETGDLTVGTAITTGSGIFRDTDLTNNSVLDSVAIISGDITIFKEQALDFTCDGSADTAFTRGRQLADPGQCIVYRLRADNTGTSVAQNVILRDTTPPFTTLELCTGACVPRFIANGASIGIGPEGGIAPADEARGLIATDIPGAGLLMAPGSRVELYFTVQIDE